jgi:hypothetical protein
MDDLDRLVTRLKAEDPEFAERYERGYQAFRLGAMLQLARLSTLQRYAEAVGRELVIELGLPGDARAAARRKRPRRKLAATAVES